MQLADDVAIFWVSPRAEPKGDVIFMLVFGFTKSGTQKGRHVFSYSLISMALGPGPRMPWFVSSPGSPESQHDQRCSCPGRG